MTTLHSSSRLLVVACSATKRGDAKYTPRLTEMMGRFGELCGLRIPMRKRRKWPSCRHASAFDRQTRRSKCTTPG